MPTNATTSKAEHPPEFNDKEDRVFKKLQKVPGLVLAHGLGTGKTRTSIQMANTIGKPTSVVVHAALQDNYKKELNRWLGKTPDNFHIESQQGAAVSGLKHQEDNTLVVDEAHRARDPGSKLLASLKKSQASKRLLLTASPVYNHPADLSPLINLAARKNVLPENRAEFSNRYIGTKQVKPSLLGRLAGIQPGQEQYLKESPDLRNAIKNYVDYQGGRSEGFPAASEQVIKVP